MNEQTLKDRDLPARSAAYTRRAGKPPLAQASRVPRRQFYGTAMNCLIAALHMAHKVEEAKPNSSTLFGYQVPAFQRPDDRWNRQQQVRFIESIYLGANIGAFMVNVPSVATDKALDNVLLDGLQRLTALKSYFRGEFAVQGEDGSAVNWPNLDASEQAHLLRVTFPWVMTSYTSLEQLMDAYDRHNFGGTAHTATDREHLAMSRLTNKAI